MISQKNISDLIQSFESKPHPEFRKDWLNIQKAVNFKSFKKTPFYNLREIMRMPKTINLSHNGNINLALPFSEVVYDLNLCKNPKEIPIKYEDGYKFREFKINFPEASHSHVRDYNPEIFENLVLRFFESFFNLKKETFRSCIIECGYGLRVDRNGQLGNFLERAVKEQIPLFINHVDLLPYDNSTAAYVINGFSP